MSHFNWVMAHAETSHVTHEWVMSHARAHFTCKLCHTLEPVISQINEFFSHEHRFTCTGRRRCIGCLRLQVSFRKRATNYRALLQKMTKIRHPMGLRHPVDHVTHIQWRSHVTQENEPCLIYMSVMRHVSFTCHIYRSHLQVSRVSFMRMRHENMSHDCHSLTHSRIFFKFVTFRTYPWHLRHIRDIHNGSAFKTYGEATVSRIDKMIGLFCRISSVL